MAEQVVEIEKTVTESETITICDDCGREVDSDGERLSMHDSKRQIDVCSDCLSNFTNREESSHVRRAKEWVNKKEQYASGVRCIKNDVGKADDIWFKFFVAEFLTVFAVGVLLFVGISIPTTYIFVFVLLHFIVDFAVGIYIHSAEMAVRKIDE